jgi:hypothetical protein
MRLAAYEEVRTRYETNVQYPAFLDMVLDLLRGDARGGQS